MTATQDLIAAALTAADELDFIYKHAPVEHTTSDLREACARAMVQPAAPDMAEVERLADVYADHVFSDGLLGRKVPSEHAATAHAALLDYVRSIMAERDELIADNERLSGLYEQAVKGRADMRSALRGARAAAPQPVSAAEVQFPIPNKTLYGADRTVSGHFYTAAKVRTYGDAREAAGYAAGVAAGGKNSADDCSTCHYAAPTRHEQCSGCEQNVTMFINYKRASWAALRGEVKP